MQIGARSIADMTEAQRRVHDAIASGPRGGVPLPFLAMLDAPHLADAVQAVGAAIRFSGAMPADVRELAILATAGAFGSGYEWDYHLPIARDAGVGETAIAMAAGRSGSDGVSPRDAAIIQLCRAAVLNRRVERDRLAELVRLTDRQVASEVVAISGYYQLLALFLSAGELDHPVAHER